MQVKFIKHIAAAVVAMYSLSSCTDLDETVYSQVSSNNYYNTRENVIAMAMRSFEHGFWSISDNIMLNEETGDQLITPTRDAHWDGAGLWRDLHKHTYKPDNHFFITGEWTSCYGGIGLCNFITEEFSKLNPADYQFSEAEFNSLKTQNRVLRAWFYLRLLDAFRNVPLTVSFSDQSQNVLSQVEPKRIFEFIESELKESIPLLYKKKSLGSGSQYANTWTQAGAAALLVRLYLNAEIYIGENRYADCERVAQDILDGVYGSYKVDDRWDAPFDWNNDTCDELLFFFSASQHYSAHHYVEIYCHTVPAFTEVMFNDYGAKLSGHNSKLACSPSYRPNGQKYDFKLGMTVDKFRKYPSDVRLIKYRNLGNSKREGMFLFGYLEYEQGGQLKRVTAPDMNYTYYLRDAVGHFRFSLPTTWLNEENSTMQDGDFNSGYCFVKYPHYPDGDAGQRESDFAMIRLPEIIYSLAECKLRKGETEEAACLVNEVRRRYYPRTDYRKVLYAPEGEARLDMDEMLDEWGREFLCEGRRRIDLIRHGVFCSGEWWDKSPEADRHSEIFPIPTSQLNSNTLLKQNPGY